jgi:hypothetical protein
MNIYNWNDLKTGWAGMGRIMKIIKHKLGRRMLIIRDFKMPTTKTGTELVWLKACFHIALTEADKIYISP